MTEVSSMRWGWVTIRADIAEAVAMLRRLLAAVDPAWVRAAAAIAGVLVALVTALTGLRSLRQLRTDSRERSRPMMAAELRKPPYVHGTQLLVIRNYGPSIAHNVKVAFDPPIPEPIPQRAAESVSPFITRRYAEPIPVVTPGMELINIWLSGRLEGNEWVNFEPMPPQFTVTIAYDSPDGTRYQDSFPLDRPHPRGDLRVVHRGAGESGQGDQEVARENRGFAGSHRAAQDAVSGAPTGRYTSKE
jgi:hypothetical protein